MGLLVVCAAAFALWHARADESVNARLLALCGTALEIRATATSATIQVPAALPDPIATVIRVE